MAARKIQLGMVGAGKMATWHLKAYRGIGQVQAAAIANPMSDRGAHLARRHRIPGQYRDAMEMIRDADLDAIDICSPPESHKDYILAALDRGLDVYVEKPMCISAAEAEQVVQANVSAGRIIFNGFNYRYWPEMQKTARAVRSGGLGRVRFVRMIRTTKDTPELAGQNARPAELFSGFHSHFVDLMRLFGFEHPQTVYACGTTVHDWPESPDTAVLLLTYADGAVAEITTSGASPGLAPEILLIGDGGTLRVDFGRVTVIPQRERWSLGRLVAMMLRKAMTVPYRVLRNPFVPSCRHFVRCVLQREVSDSDEHAALSVLRVTDAAEASYLQHQPVSLAAEGPDPSAAGADN